MTVPHWQKPVQSSLRARCPNRALEQCLQRHADTITDEVGPLAELTTLINWDAAAVGVV